ncbi:MAG: 4-(cytidine 5'-diphospho)-2-C-methyl-D-erythritol kinase [Bacteroidales bacterium]|nr:4-(cytidine 5'-diphospho)-2-C-methyl-D-erythritol kinase [Bacteroidales bacterium]
MITYPNVKINLGLSVLRKRPDGYHDLETLFVPYFGLHDTLEIIPGDGWSETSASLFARYGNAAQAISPDGKVMITIARKEGVDWDPLKDLTVKAYYALASDYSLPPVKIFLEKGSPVGAGLGGGSADAAFALGMLSEIAGLGLGEEQLAAYAAGLGSDCAFFVHNRPMIGRGRGEILTPWNLDLEGYELRVVVPEGIAVSTAEAYRGVRPRFADGVSASDMLPLEQVLQMPVEQWKDLLVNDFEPSVFKAHPELEAIKRKLYDEGAVYAAMSGSGSAMFALFRK